jgi:uncharacterized protein YcaQ
MFPSTKTQNSRLMKYLPNEDSLLPLEDYNILYKRMMEVQSDEKKKEELEQQHRTLVSNVLSAKIDSLKLQRKKK